MFWWNHSHLINFCNILQLTLLTACPSLTKFGAVNDITDVCVTRAGAWELDECASMLFFDGGVRAWPPMVVSQSLCLNPFFVLFGHMQSKELNSSIPCAVSGWGRHASHRHEGAGACLSGMWTCQVGACPSWPNREARSASPRAIASCTVAPLSHSPWPPHMHVFECVNSTQLSSPLIHPHDRCANPPRSTLGATTLFPLRPARSWW
jgi:hypothetical protein